MLNVHAYDDDDAPYFIGQLFNSPGIFEYEIVYCFGHKLQQWQYQYDDGICSKYVLNTLARQNRNDALKRDWHHYYR